MILTNEMAEFLDNQGLGTFDINTSNGDIYVMTMPSSPDDIICLYQRGGLVADGKLGYDNPKIQIMVRGVQLITTQQKAQDVYNIFQGFHGKSFITNGIHIVNCIGEQSAPNFIGKDTNRRFEFSLNFTLEIKNFEGGRSNGNC